jgi:hypothetical protein
MRARLTLAVAIFAAAVQAQMPTCPGSGLTVTGGRLGDVFSLEIDGPAGAAAVLAADVAGGPVMTPYGSICLGMTPALVTSPCTLDANGRFGLSGVLPLASPFPAGSTQFLQAALAHPTLPGGFTLTNGVAATIRAPRLALFHFSCWTCGQPASLTLLDAVTDTVASALPSIPWTGANVVHLKRQGWFGWKVNIPSNLPPATLPPNLPSSGTFVCIDDQTGATVFTIPNVWSMDGDEWAVSEDGDYLSVILTGAAPVYDRFWVKTYALPSGNLLSVQAVSSSGYVPHGVYHIPGTSIAYLASSDRFHVYDGAAGNEIATVLLPGNLGDPSLAYGEAFNAVVVQGMLYCVAGNSLIAIDTASHTIVGQGPATLNGLKAHGLGPGSAGPAIWASAETNGSAGQFQLVEIPLSTLTPIVVAQVAGRPMSAAVSAGGTEMIFGFTVGFTHQSMVVNGATHAAVVLPGVRSPTPLRSNTLTKAYGLVTAPLSFTLLSFATDPCTGATTDVPATVGLPFLSN